MTTKTKNLLAKIKTGEFVYPSQATDWNRFFQLIKSKLPNSVDIPNPLILGGAGASNYSKNQRLQEHLRIAEEHGLLELALGMLSRIPEDKWVTSTGDLDPNEPSYWELEKQHQREIHSKWFFKPIEMLQTNLATIDENQEGRILFVVETGWIFDALSYLDNETAEKKLRLNGFKRCDDDPVFEKLSFIPDTLHEGTRNPVYSSGKHWRE
jgi:hypothetical protein